MLETLSQPIVNIITGEKVMEERLSRPGCLIKDYFSTKDRNTLLRRELHAILQCVEESGNTPYNINVTLYTLPILCKLPFSWNGGVEIVEWDRSISPYFKQTRMAIRDLQSRGLSVWADDVTLDAVDMWLKAGINGFKVEIEALRNDDLFIDRLRATKKPIVVERIETKEDHEFVKSLGIMLGQGFFYGVPSKSGDVEGAAVSQYAVR
ncbi:MAG: hypothetical protein ACM3UW_01830 [Bacillota bacterium]